MKNSQGNVTLEHTHIKLVFFLINSAPGQRPQLFLLYSLMIHSSMNPFSEYSRQFILSFFFKCLRNVIFFHSFNMAKPTTFFLSGKQTPVIF